MAGITSALRESVYKINRFLGVNENPDGDTQLKPGEASEMRNFRITQEGNLQKRPGIKAIHATKNMDGTDPRHMARVCQRR